jgi:hypothetical protein
MSYDPEKPPTWYEKLRAAADVAFMLIFIGGGLGVVYGYKRGANAAGMVTAFFLGIAICGGLILVKIFISLAAKQK